jgi:hypothetical protein
MLASKSIGNGYATNNISIDIAQLQGLASTRSSINNQSSITNTNIDQAFKQHQHRQLRQQSRASTTSALIDHSTPSTLIEHRHRSSTNIS